MEWKKATKNENNTFEIPNRWLHVYYYEALNILFRFENALRVFVYTVLKTEFGEKWDLTSVSDNSTIKNETKKRIAQAKEHGYLGYEVSSPMLYLNSGELIQIIQSDAYWKHFAPFFKASKAIVLTKLQEIGTVRNSLAHFRPIKEDDIDLIKQNSKHVLLEIENCLVQLTSISDLVPTNSEEHWYKNIKPIGSDNITTALFISRDQNWIRIELSYKIPTLDKTNYGADYLSFKIGNLRTSELLRNYNSIRNNCIYVSEHAQYGQLNEKFEVANSKVVSIVFSRKGLEKHLQLIVAELADIVLKVDSETDLLSKDHLARGELIESKNATANVKTRPNGDKYWNVSIESINTPLTEIDDVEFWGQRGHYVTDFISATTNYPWMPSSVSEFDWEF